ncbi:Hypothetical protein PBC10988_16810 [Planctomycetales bacterium 10988]|nr:Hypothetical protein PBC10988_16810 [Planctomycetales bacterium 10988]
MSFFSRLTDIVTTNMTDFLEKSDDPQLVLQQLITEMEAGVSSAQRSAVAALARTQKLAHDLERYQERIQFWNSKAKESVQLQQEDLAKRCLIHRRETVDVAAALEDQYQEALAKAEHLKLTLRALEARLQEAKRRHARLNQAEETASSLEVQTLLTEIKAAEAEVPTPHFDLEAAEAEALQKLEAETKEIDLEAFKAQMDL